MSSFSRLTGLITKPKQSSPTKIGALKKSVNGQIGSVGTEGRGQSHPNRGPMCTATDSPSRVSAVYSLNRRSAVQRRIRLARIAGSEFGLQGGEEVGPRALRVSDMHAASHSARSTTHGLAQLRLRAKGATDWQNRKRSLHGRGQTVALSCQKNQLCPTLWAMPHSSAGLPTLDPNTLSP